MGNDSGDTRDNSTERSAQASQAQFAPKRMGELAEMAFVYKAASLGFGVAKPYGDSHPYDFLIQHGRRLLRIQVKSVFAARGEGRSGYAVAAARHRRRGRAIYSEDDIDFIAAFVAPHDAWYVIPVKALGGRKVVYLHPLGPSRRDGGMYEAYREAWHLMKDHGNRVMSICVPSSPAANIPR